jgi:hypothetical protein|tara:strand:- start:251 stop:736 length:486 start_codon:yes stop_codon:yes gene_type:complete
MDNFHNFNTPMLNIDELHQKDQEKTTRKFEVYQKILEKCHNKITSTSRHSNNMGFCFYNVPKYIFGIPLYDIKSCVMFLVSALVKNGFDVKYTHPNLLFISWQNKTNKNALMLEAPKQESNYSSEYSNSNSNSNNDENSLLFNTKKVSSVDDKLEKLLKNL